MKITLDSYANSIFRLGLVVAYSTCRKLGLIYVWPQSSDVLELIAIISRECHIKNIKFWTSIRSGGMRRRSRGT